MTDKQPTLAEPAKFDLRRYCECHDVPGCVCDACQAAAELERLQQAMSRCVLNDPPGDCYGAEVVELRARVAELEGTMRADEKRLRDAAARVGNCYWGCDTPDVMADKILELEAEANKLALQVTGLCGERDSLQARVAELEERLANPLENPRLLREIDRLQQKVTDLSNEAYTYAEQVEELQAENERLRGALESAPAVEFDSIPLGVNVDTMESTSIFDSQYKVRTGWWRVYRDWWEGTRKEALGE